MKGFRLTLGTALFIAFLVLFAGCDNPLAEDDGEQEQQETVPVADGDTVDIGEAGSVTIATPVELDVSVLEDSQGYPDDAKTPLLQISGSLPEGESATLSFTLAGGASSRDEIVRATTVDEEARWQEMGTTTLAEDGETLSLEVADIDGVWGVVTAPPAPEVTLSTQEGTEGRPTWSWSSAEADEPLETVRHRIGEDSPWSVVASPADKSSYTPSEPLVLGEHTLTVQAGTGTGVWSNNAEATYERLYQATSFFPDSAGFGVEYSVKDTYDYGSGNVANNGDPFDVWAVTQTDMEPDTPFAGIVTIIPETDIGNRGPQSALVFTTGYPTGDQDFGDLVGYIGGVPERHSANLYRHMVSLPEDISDGQTGTDNVGVEFSYSYNGEHTVGDRTFSDTIRISVTIDTEAATELDKGAGDTPRGFADMYEGTGEVILAPGIGVIEIGFDRAHSADTSLSFIYKSHNESMTHHSVSGTADGAGSGAFVGFDLIVGEFTPQGESTAYQDPTPPVTTDGSGNFSIQVYGPQIQLYAGVDENNDGLMDDPQSASYYAEGYVQDTSTAGGVTLSQP